MSERNGNLNSHLPSILNSSQASIFGGGRHVNDILKKPLYFVLREPSKSMPAILDRWLLNREKIEYDEVRRDARLSHVSFSIDPSDNSFGYYTKDLDNSVDDASSLQQ